MTGQIREDLGPLQDTCAGMRLWIVGSGPSLDSIPLGALRDQYIFALNSSIALFKNVRKYPDAWWLWWDMRAYHECWEHVQDWQRIQCICHKKGMETLRSHRGSGRYVHYIGEQFRPERSVVETALLIADFLGFSESVLVGVDGLREDARGRPYCAAINDWKPCHFMKRDKPGSSAKSAASFEEAMEALAPRLEKTRVIQTSPFYSGEQFERSSFKEVIETKVGRNSHVRTAKVAGPDSPRL